MMDDLERHRRRRGARQSALRRLGVTNVICLCGQTDPLCFEADHIDRRVNSGVVWGCCVSCHRRKSLREQTEHPYVGIALGDPFARMGHQLLGIASYLELAMEGLRKDADFMFKQVGKGTPTEE